MLPLTPLPFLTRFALRRVVGGRRRLEFIVKRFTLNRSMSLAWGRWMFYLHGVQLAKDKKSRCCKMIKSVIFRRMGMETSHAFHHWSVQRLNMRIREGKMRVFGGKKARFGCLSRHRFSRLFRPSQECSPRSSRSGSIRA